MSSFARNPLSSGRNVIPPPRRPSTAIVNQISDDDSDAESFVGSDESDEDCEESVSALITASSYSSDTYADSNPSAVTGSYHSSQTSGASSRKRAGGSGIISPLHSNRTNSSRHNYQDDEYEESGRTLATIREEGSEEDEDGNREDDDDESSEGSEESDGSYSSGSSDGSSDSEDDDSSSGSDSDSSGSDSESSSENEGVKGFKGQAGGAIIAQPMDVLNAIACALWEPGPDEELSLRSGESVSSDEDRDGDMMEGDGDVELGTYSRQERDRASTVFHHCATNDGKHLNEVQFGVALALLGQTVKKEILKELFDELAISDGLTADGFFTALNRLRSKGNEEESLNRIQDAFDALYEGTCLNDDQKDFTGQRYIYACDFRLLLTVTGEDNERLTDEEANELLRDCKPIYPKIFNKKTGQEEDDGTAMSLLQGRIFFEQYRAMLLDICP